MAFITDDILSGLGLGYSITGIALVIPICFGFRQYFRFLDHLQIFYLLFLSLGSGTKIFSSYLDSSWVLFPHNFYVFCSSGDLVCTVGFPLSFTSCLIAFLLIMRIIVAFEKCRKPEIRFEPVYTFFKGFFRWTFIPLTYYSLYFLIKSVQGTSNDLIPSIVVFSVCVIFPIIQLIVYKCIQGEKDNIWRKWLEFFGYLRLGFFIAIVACAQTFTSNVPYYFIYAVYLAFVVIYAWKNTFHFPVVGRVVFILGEIFAVVISFFFIFEISLLSDYHLDFFFISAILLIDLIYYIAQTVSYVRHGVPQEGREKVNP